MRKLVVFLLFVGGMVGLMAWIISGTKEIAALELSDYDEDEI